MKLAQGDILLNNSELLSDGYLNNGLLVSFGFGWHYFGERRMVPVIFKPS